MFFCFHSLAGTFTVLHTNYWPLSCPQALPEAMAGGGMKASSQTLVPSLNEAFWYLHTPPLIGQWALLGRCAHSGYAAPDLCKRKKNTNAADKKKYKMLQKEKKQILMKSNIFLDIWFLHRHGDSILKRTGPKILLKSRCHIRKGT